jgi:thiol-disulfide isomerase/thioredoxin
MKVLKFGAKWCKDCKVMGPRWQEIEKENEWLQAEYIGIDEHPEAMNKYQILSLPTFIFLDKEGNEINRMSGIVEKDKLIEEIRRLKEK